MGAVLPAVLGVLVVAVVCLCFVLVGLVRQVDDLDRRLAQVGMAMPGKVGRLGLRVGSPAPEVQGRTLGGGRFVARDWAAAEHLVLFAHPGCPPCEELVPDIVERVGQGALPPTIIISEGRVEDHPSPWSAAADPNAHIALVLQEGSAMARRFETFVTPHLFVIDDQGRVAGQGIASTLDEVQALFKRTHRKARSEGAYASASTRGSDAL